MPLVVSRRLPVSGRLFRLPLVELDFSPSGTRSRVTQCPSTIADTNYRYAYWMETDVVWSSDEGYIWTRHHIEKRPA